MRKWIPAFAGMTCEQAPQMLWTRHGYAARKLAQTPALCDGARTGDATRDRVINVARRVGRVSSLSSHLGWILDMCTWRRRS